MRPVESKGSCSHESTQDHHSCNAYGFEFHSGAGPTKALHHHKALGSRAKPTPSKWDDAQKWLVGLSARADHKHSMSKPRNSNADDRRLLTSLSQRGRDSCSSADGVLEDDMALAVAAQDAAETKKVDCNEPLWRTNKPSEDSSVVVRSVCLRDASTEMTPIASKEPSRTGTPLRATTPVLKSPLSSRSSTPGRSRQGAEQHDDHQPGMRNPERRSEAVPFGKSSGNGWPCRGEAAPIGGSKYPEVNASVQDQNMDSLESQATAWDEAERAKYTARYKREEVKIQAWENHEKRKAETEMRRMEVKAERMRSRAQEKHASRLAAARRMAEEKRANAEGRLNEHAARTSERADYIRRTGHLPSSFFSFKLSSLCG
ncbi:remorin 4.1-like [Musa acuminata AAA Group]|uniref:remorin 4.1-like n=1 Tax=Musa acuminata AAA Group TaxID=214697 RepID=UPI0031E3B242